MKFEEFATKGIYKNLSTARLEADPSYYNAIEGPYKSEASNSLYSLIAVMSALISFTLLYSYL